MANEDKVTIEIVLDDGSIKQGFATIKKQANETAKDIQTGFSKPLVDDTGAIEKIKNIGLAFSAVAVAAAAAGALVKKAFDSALSGESILALEKSFDQLANSQGLVGLRNRLEESSRGLVDVGDLLNKSTNAILNLGDASAKLPELLDLATRSALNFGTDATQTFETFVKAIEIGNTKILRTQGLVVDSEKVFKSYAATIGTTASSLTLAQKQQALLNAVLDEGNKRAAQFDGNARPLNTSITQLGVSIAQMIEGFNKLVSINFGPFFSSLANGLKSVIDDFNQVTQATINTTQNAAVGAASLVAKQMKLRYELEAARLEYEKLGTAQELAIGASAKLKIQRLEESYARLGDQIAATGAKVSGSASGGPVGLPKASIPTTSSSPGFSLTPEQIKENQTLREQAAQQVTQLEIQTSQQLIAIKQQQFQQANSLEDQQRISSEIAYEQFKASIVARDQELAQLESTLGQNRLVTTEQMMAAKAAIIDKYNLQIANSTTESQKVVAQREQQISQSFKQGMVNSIVAASASIGNALAKGKLDFDDFGRSILNVLADTAIQLGALVISFGIAATALGTSLATFSGGEAIVAGAALVAIGTAIKAFAGGPGSGSSAVPSAGTPGGSPVQTQPFGGDASSSLTDQIDSRQPNTEVQVYIQGDVLDSEETGLRIVDIINKSFDKQGVTIKRGAVA